MFKRLEGSRPWAAHIIILITDGYSYNTEQTTMEASIARSQGIEMFAIGVGSGVDETELRAIASDPDASHMFHVESYDALKHIGKAVTTKTCNNENASSSAQGDTSAANSKEAAIKRCGGKPADVFFLLDSSSSIWKVHFDKELLFVAHLLHLFDLGPTRTRVGAAVYSDSVHNVISLSDPQSQDSVQKSLLNAPYLTGRTNTGKALNFVRTQAFAEARWDVAHVIIVVTDGQSANTTRTQLEAQKAREQGVYVFSVGIGSSTDMAELMGIASDPDENFVFHVDNFEGLNNIRELLAMKTCDVKVPDVQGEQPVSGCSPTKPTDILFVYDSASISRKESNAISDVIRHLVETLQPDPDTVRFGLVRENCYKGDNIDVKTGAKADVLRALLQKPHHKGLHALLKRVRLHGFLDDYDERRASVRKLMVLFMSSKITDQPAVRSEIKRIRFQGVHLMVVAVDTARENLTLLTKLSDVPPLEIRTYEKLHKSRQDVFDKFCELNRSLY